MTSVENGSGEPREGNRWLVLKTDRNVSEKNRSRRNFDDSCWFRNHREGLIRSMAQEALFQHLTSNYPQEAAMTKADIVDRIAKGTGLTKIETKAVVEGFMTTVKDAMEEGKRIELRGFGVFEVDHRAPRTGRNPQTNEPVPIDERFEPVFRPSDQFREAVDEVHKERREEEEADA